MSYLTPETINAAIARYFLSGSWPVLSELKCTRSRASIDFPTWNVYTSDGVLVFTGNPHAIGNWLRNSDPACTFAELSPMRRDRLVAAFVGPGRDLLGSIRKHATEQGAGIRCDVQLVTDVWDCFARYGGWSYLQTLESPASVAAEALSQWSSQTDNDGRDDPGAYDGY